MRMYDKGIYRDMTEEEIEALNHLLDPTKADEEPTAEEIVDILTGETE